MRPETACVYFHINSDTKEVFYVGIGNIKRPYQKSHRSTFWKNYTNKYKYEVQIVHTDVTWEEACEKEIEYISEFGRRDLDTGSLVNMTNGGEGRTGFKWSDEQKEEISKRMSLSNKGRTLSESTKDKIRTSSIGRVVLEETRIKIKTSNTGKKHTEETKLKISEKRKGTVISEETRLKMSESAKNRRSKGESICR